MSLAHKKPEVCLILDVQSTLVRGIIVLLEEKEPKVIFSTETGANIDPEQNSTDLAKNIIKAVKETVKVCLENFRAKLAGPEKELLPHKIASVHYALSTPWIVSQAEIISASFEKETTITKKHVLAMIDKERSKAVPSNSAPLQIIEQKIFDVRLNGYSVTDWQDKNAKNLEVAFAVSIAGTSMVQYLLDECRPVASSGHIHFHSALLLKLIGVEKALNLGENFNLIYVHGEMTDLAVIERHSCIFFGSLPIGSITLGRMVAESAKCDRQAADSLISLYFSNQLDKSSGKDQSAAVKESIAKWGEGVSKLIADSKVPLASSNAIVLSAGHLNDFFGQAVATVYPKSKISFVPAEDFLPTAIHSLNLSE